MLRFVRAFGTSFEKNFTAWFVGAVFAIFSVFSGELAERIKFSLNKADARSEHYEQLAEDFSNFVFRAELFPEFLHQNWTTKPTLTSLVKNYNDAIRTVRRKEYIYISWIDRYWERKDAQQFDTVMKLVKEFDQELHDLNQEFEEVNIIESKEKMEVDVASLSAYRLEAIVKDLKAETRKMLSGFM